MKHTHLLIAFSLMVLIANACGSPTGVNGDTPQAGTTPVNGGQAESPNEAQIEVQGEPFISAPNVAFIQLLTDIESAGVKPLFAWEVVSGASRYQLIVFDEAGEPYWAWEGTGTQIYIGGTDAQPPDDSSGPTIDVGYTWAVAEYDSDGKILAASEIRSISP